MQGRNAIMLAGALVAFGGQAARADFFSWASDGNADGPTFRGLPSTVGFGALLDGRPLSADGIVQGTFMWDADEDGPGAAVAIPAAFTFAASAIAYSPQTVGSTTVHNLVFTGSYAFTRLSDGATILTVSFNNALFSGASSSAGSLGESAALQSNFGIDPGMTFTPGTVLSGRDLSALESFAFSLSALRDEGGGSAAMNPSAGFAEAWRSEGSWSARAVPAPGAACLLAGGVLWGVGARRKRR